MRNWINRSRSNNAIWGGSFLGAGIALFFTLFWEKIVAILGLMAYNVYKYT